MDGIIDIPSVCRDEKANFRKPYVLFFLLKFEVGLGFHKKQPRLPPKFK